MDSPRVVTLTTDFGSRDAYVGVVKGVILGIAPYAHLVDISHEVRPQAISEAAFLLLTGYRYFPGGTVHLAVVDPGVGTARRPIAVVTESAGFVGPDNGIFAPVLADQGVMDPESGSLAGARAFELAAPEYMLPTLSRTFHGRDIFGPAAAHMAAGVDPAEFGPPVERLATLGMPEARIEDGRIHGRIIHVDRFGNAISNVSGEMIPDGVTVEAAGRVIGALSSSYRDAELVALVGSSGLLEVAARDASASEVLGLRIGDEIVVRSLA